MAFILAIKMYCSAINPNQDLLDMGYSEESIEWAYLIGDETGDYGFLDEAI